MIEDAQAESLAKSAARRLLKAAIASLLRALDDHEEFVIRLRYGIGSDKPRTLEESSLRVGGSRERVRQIERGALRRLPHPSRSQSLLQIRELRAV